MSTVAPTAAKTNAPTIAPTILSTVKATVTTTTSPVLNTGSIEPVQSHVDFGSVLWHVYFDTLDAARVERSVLSMQTEIETIAPVFLEEKLQEVLFQFSDSIAVKLSLTPLMDIHTFEDASVASFSVTGRVTFQAEFAPRAVAVRDIVVSWLTAVEFIEYWQEQSSSALVKTVLYTTHGSLVLPETDTPTFAPQSLEYPKEPAEGETTSSSGDEAPAWYFWEHIEFLDWGNYYFIGFVSLCGSLLIMVVIFGAVCCLRRRKRRRILAKEAQSIAKVLTESNSNSDDDDAKYDLEGAKRNLYDSLSVPQDDDESWTRTDGSTLPESILPSTLPPEDTARAPSPNTSLYSYTDKNKFDDIESQLSDDNGFSMDFGANVSGIVLPQPELDENIDLPPSEPSEMPEPIESASLGSIPIVAVDLSRESEQKGTVLVYDDNDDCSLSTTSDSMYGEYPARPGSPPKMFTSQPPKVLSRYPLPSSITDSPTKSSPLPEPRPPTKKVLSRYPLPQSLLSPPKKEAPPTSPSKSVTLSSPGKKSSVLAAVAMFEAAMNKNKPWIKDDESDASEPTESDKEKPPAVSPESRRSTDTTSAASPDTFGNPSPNRLIIDEVEAADLTMPTPDTVDIATPTKTARGQGPPQRDLSSPKKLSSRWELKKGEGFQIKSIFRPKDKPVPGSSKPVPKPKSISKFDAVVEKPKTTTAEKLSSAIVVTPNQNLEKKAVKVIDRSEVGKENGFFGRRSHSESPSKRPPKPSFVLKTDVDAVQESPRRNRRSQSVAPSARFQGMSIANDFLDRSIETSLTWASTAGFSLRSGRTSRASQSLLDEEDEFGVPTTLPPTPQALTEYSESETSDIQSICSKEFSFKGKREGSRDNHEKSRRLGVGNAGASTGIRVPAASR